MCTLFWDYLLIAVVVGLLAAFYYKKAGTTKGVWKSAARVGLMWPVLLWRWIASKFSSAEPEKKDEDKDTTPPAA